MIKTSTEEIVDKGERESFKDPLMQRIDRIFIPGSVAIIGASDTPGKWGFSLLSNTIASGFEGEVYPVNPKKETILGMTCYARVQDIPYEVDLAVITIPAKGIASALKDCVEKGIHSALIVTSGFREVGEEGRVLEEEIARIAREGNISFVGPNTMGIMSAPARMTCMSTPVFPTDGSVALISQSGNVGIQFMQWSSDKGSGISYFAGVGNEAVLSAKDYLRYFAQKDDVNTIAMYMEGVSEGREFMKTAREITLNKPVIVLKSGKTAEGSKAASSHTGAMAGSYATSRAMFKQCGIVEVNSPFELINVSAALSSLPLPKSNRVGVVTFGGGWGVLTADECIKAGLELPVLPDAVIKEIDPYLPDFWNRGNPVDLVGEYGDNVMKILEIVANWDDVDSVITLGIVGFFTIMKNFIKFQRRFKNTPLNKELKKAVLKERIQREHWVYSEIARIQKAVKKPIINVTLGATGIQTLVNTNYGKAICLTSPEEATSVLSYMVGYRRYVESHREEESGSL